MDEPEHLCAACGGDGRQRDRADGGLDDCEHCDGSGQEPCPPKGDLERALLRAEEKR